MKKIYALCAASLVAATAFASPKSLHNGEVAVKAAPFASEKVATVHNQIAEGLLGQDYTFAPSKAQSSAGADWTVRINVNADRWCDVLAYSDGSKPSFEDVPFYWVTFYTYDDASSVSRVFYDICMPAQAYFDHADDDNWWIDDENFDWDRAAEEYGSLEAAQAIVDVEQFTSYLADNNEVLYLYPYGYIPGYYGLFNMTLFSTSNPSYCTYKGTTNLYLRPMTVSGNSYVTSGAAYLGWTGYDADTMDIEAELYAPLGTVGDSGTFGTLKGTISETIEGSAAVFGFTPAVLDLGEVHIFNLGAADEDAYIGTYNNSDYTFGDLFENFEPANLYEYAFCSKTTTFGTIEETTLPTKAFATEETTQDTYYYFLAKVLLDSNSDPENVYPEGIAVDEFWSYDNSGFLTTTIKPGVAFSGYRTSKCADSTIASALLGSSGVLYAWGAYPYPGDGESIPYPTYAAGDKTVGFNGKFQTSLGSTVTYSYTGDIQYHYDADDYRVVKTIPAIGNADANVIGDTNSVKTVLGSNADVVSTQYFNLQGIRLNGAPEKGIYIVRNLKADGSIETVKVAK